MNRNLLDGVALRPEVRVRQLIRLFRVQIFEFHLHVHHALDLVTLKVEQDEEKERDLRARETGRACERQKIPIRARAVRRAEAVVREDTAASSSSSFSE